MLEEGPEEGPPAPPEREDSFELICCLRYLAPSKMMGDSSISARLSLLVVLIAGSWLAFLPWLAPI